MKRRGLLPGEYRKRSTVYVQRVRLSEDVDKFGDADLLTTDAYIVQTRRIDTEWTYLFECNGQVIRIPAAVLDRFISHRESIIREQRSDRGKDRARVKAEALLEDIDMRGV